MIQGRAPLLPDITEDFGGKLLKGLLVWVITVIYFFPLIVVTSFSGLIVAVTGETLEMESAGFIVSGCCVGLASLVLGVAGGIFLPYAWGSYAETGKFGAAFQIGKLFGMIKANIGPTLLALLIIWLANMIIAPIGSIVCIIGVIFTQFYVQLITAFLYGSLYQDAQAKTL